MNISLKQIKASDTGKRFDCIVEIGDWLFGDDISHHQVRVLSAEPMTPDEFKVLVRKAGKRIGKEGEWGKGKVWRRFMPAAPKSVLFQALETTEEE